VAGISSLFIVALSYLCFVLFLLRYSESRRIETLLSGLVFLAIGSNWLGVLLSFLMVLGGGEPLGQVTMLRVWSWAPAVTGTIWIYLALSLLRPKLKNPITAIYLVLDVIYWGLMYTRTMTYSTYQIVGGIPDSGVKDIAIVFLLFYILTALVVIAPMYLWIGFKSQRPETQVRGKVIGTGVAMFAFFAIFETVIPPSAGLLIISRLLILTAIFLMYVGFTLPNWLRQRIAILAVKSA
jgi:hypothetical protein